MLEEGLKKLGIDAPDANLEQWHSVMKRFNSRNGKVTIGIVGKYMDLHDAYKSVYEALFHAGLECGVEVELVKIDSSKLENPKNLSDSKDPWDPAAAAGENKKFDGILVPGGFGQRGITGMVKIATWARTNKVPFFGIGLGMHVMMIDWGRNVLNWEDADSTEFNPDTKHPVVSLLEEQSDVKKYGGAVRLGKGTAAAESGSRLFSAYGEKNISERHRHRYVFSNMYRSQMKESGLLLTGFTQDGLVECVEWPEHPWGLGVQFHPEFKSRPAAAAPLFRDFIAAAKEKQNSR